MFEQLQGKRNLIRSERFEIKGKGMKLKGIKETGLARIEQRHTEIEVKR